MERTPGENSLQENISHCAGNIWSAIEAAFHLHNSGTEGYEDMKSIVRELREELKGFILGLKQTINQTTGTLQNKLTQFIDLVENMPDELTQSYVNEIEKIGKQ